jgi:hypothetical protein
MSGRINVGDIVQVFNPLMAEEHSFFRVYRVEGNKAVTKFRTFNHKIWPRGAVYEFGQRQHPLYNNGYSFVSEDGINYGEDVKRIGGCDCIFCKEEEGDRGDKFFTRLRVVGNGAPLQIRMRGAVT